MYIEQTSWSAQRALPGSGTAQPVIKAATPHPLSKSEIALHIESENTAAEFSSCSVCSSCESSSCFPQPVVPRMQEPRQRLVTSSILRRLDARVQRRWPCSENPGGLSRLRSYYDRPDVNQQARS